MKRSLIIRTCLIFVSCTALLGAVLAIYFAVSEESGQVAQVTPISDTFAEPGSVLIGGPFTMTDHSGETVTSKDFRDSYLLVFFGFSNCPDVCPTTLADIARTLELLDEKSAFVQSLFVSLDPERDTPERLAEYVAAFDPKIVGLTGTPEQVAAVADQYRVYYEKVSAAAYSQQGSESSASEKAAETSSGEDYMISHQGNTYLMSPEGQYLTHFSYGTRPEAMAKTIRKAFAKFGRPND